MADICELSGLLQDPTPLRRDVNRFTMECFLPPSNYSYEGGDDGNAKKRSRFMRMARKLRNKGFEVTCPAGF